MYTQDRFRVLDQCVSLMCMQFDLGFSITEEIIINAHPK